MFLFYRATCCGLRCSQPITQDADASRRLRLRGGTSGAIAQQESQHAAAAGNLGVVMCVGGCLGEHDRYVAAFNAIHNCPS